MCHICFAYSSKSNEPHNKMDKTSLFEVICRITQVPLILQTTVMVTTHLENLEKSGNSKVVREKSGKMEKVREKSGEVKSGVCFSSSKYSKTRFRSGLCPGPHWGAYDAPPDPLVGWGGGHPIPFPICYNNPNC